MSLPHNYNVIRKPDLRIGDRPWLRERKDCKKEDLLAAGLEEDELMGRPCIVVETLPQDLENVRICLCFTFSKRQIEDVEYIPASEQQHYLPIHPQTSPRSAQLRFVGKPAVRHPGYACASRVYIIPVHLLSPRDSRPHVRLTPPSTVLLLQSIQNLKREAEAAYQQALAEIELTHKVHLRSRGVTIKDRNAFVQDMHQNCGSCKILIAAAASKVGVHGSGRGLGSTPPASRRVASSASNRNTTPPPMRSLENVCRAPVTPRVSETPSAAPIAPRWPSDMTLVDSNRSSLSLRAVDPVTPRVSRSPSSSPPAAPKLLTLTPARAADAVTPTISVALSSAPATPRWRVGGRHWVTLLD